jgi:hypothetical protein
MYRNPRIGRSVHTALNTTAQARRHKPAGFFMPIASREILPALDAHGHQRRKQFGVIDRTGDQIGKT